MNIPFRFALHTVDNPYGFFFVSNGAALDGNKTLISIAAAAGLGANAAARLLAAGVTPPSATNKLWINGFSLTAWNSDDTQNVKCDIGLWDSSNAVFIPLYECVATGVASGGIQKTFGAGETGIYVPQSTTLSTCLRVTKQGTTDGSVTVAGDISLYVQVA